MNDPERSILGELDNKIEKIPVKDIVWACVFNSNGSFQRQLKRTEVTKVIWE